MDTGDLWQVNHSGIYPGHSGPLSLAVPPWLGPCTYASTGNEWTYTDVLVMVSVIVEEETASSA